MNKLQLNSGIVFFCYSIIRNSCAQVLTVKLSFLQMFSSARDNLRNFPLPPCHDQKAIHCLSFSKGCLIFQIAGTSTSLASSAKYQSIVSFIRQSVTVHSIHYGRRRVVQRNSGCGRAKIAVVESN